MHYYILIPSSKFREEDDLEILMEEIDDLVSKTKSELSNTSMAEIKTEKLKRKKVSESENLNWRINRGKLCVLDETDSRTSSPRKIPLHTTIATNNSTERMEHRKNSIDLSHHQKSADVDSGNDPPEKNDDCDNENECYNDNDSSTATENEWQRRQEFENDDKFRYELLKNYYSSTFSGPDSRSADVSTQTTNSDHHDDYDQTPTMTSLREVPDHFQDIAYENGKIKWTIATIRKRSNQANHYLTTRDTKKMKEGPLRARSMILSQ